MSEFQYYAFQAIDRPLTQQERAALRKISSRAEITATSFTNEYNWGDLSADPAKLVERYFDAHFYLANWGSRTLILRFPAQAVPLAAVSPYAFNDAVRVWSTKTHTLVQFTCEEENIDKWWEDKEALDDLIGLRQQIISGDYRSLYIAWLDAVAREIDEDLPAEDIPSLPSPPIPPGLGALNETLKSFAYVFFFDRDLIAAAAKHSAPLAQPSAAQDERALKAFIAKLDTRTKDALLLRVARQDPSAGPELTSLFRSQQSATAQTPIGATSLAAIIQESEQLRAAHAKAEATRQREASEAQAKAEAKQRAARRQEITNHWEHHWANVAADINFRQRSTYQIATKMLVELKDAATTDAQKIDFQTRLSDIRVRHKSLISFIKMLNAAGL